MIYDNLDDYLTEQLPPQDETEAKAMAERCNQVFASSLPPTKPAGQTKLDFGHQEEMFTQ